MEQLSCTYPILKVDFVVFMWRHYASVQNYIHSGKTNQTGSEGLTHFLARLTLKLVTLTQSGFILAHIPGTAKRELVWPPGIGVRVNYDKVFLKFQSN